MGRHTTNHALCLMMVGLLIFPCAFWYAPLLKLPSVCLSRRPSARTPACTHAAGPRASPRTSRFSRPPAHRPRASLLAHVDGVAAAAAAAAAQ